jgi:hypothetical protein
VEKKVNVDVGVVFYTDTCSEVEVERVMQMAMMKAAAGTDFSLTAVRGIMDGFDKEKVVDVMHGVCYIKQQGEVAMFYGMGYRYLGYDCGLEEPGNGDGSGGIYDGYGYEYSFGGGQGIGPDYGCVYANGHGDGSGNYFCHDWSFVG